MGRKFYLDSQFLSPEASGILHRPSIEQMEMAEVADVAKPCSNPGCDQPGTKSCSACKTSIYCSVICQTADWPRHREECDGHLRKVGLMNLDKAAGFHEQQNWLQTLRYAEIASTKLKQLKDRRLETVKLIDSALSCTLDAYGLMGRFKEGKECAEERYSLWAMNQMRNPGSINAALHLIQSCIHNNDYEDAEHYARHAMFMINDMADNFIPSDQRSKFLADGSYYLSQSILLLARAGGIPPGEKQKAGEEATELARQALKIHTQLHGTECSSVAAVMNALTDVLDYFNNVDDDEILRLLEQAVVVFSRVEGNLSYNVAHGKGTMGNVYINRAKRAHAANDTDRCIVNNELALSHYREAVRIFRAINRVDSANSVLGAIAGVEERLRTIRHDRAATAAASIKG